MGTVDQARHVRVDLARVANDCPVLDDLVLLTSEFVTNAILHSHSGHPDRTFTVRATLYPGDYAWVEVIDRGADGRPTSSARSTGAVWRSLPQSRETGTGQSTAMPPAAQHGSGLTGHGDGPAQVRSGRRTDSRSNL